MNEFFSYDGLEEADNLLDKYQIGSRDQLKQKIRLVIHSKIIMVLRKVTIRLIFIEDISMVNSACSGTPPGKRKLQGDQPCMSQERQSEDA